MNQEINGLKEGLWIDKYSNGNIESVINYLNNKRHGLCKHYYINNNIFCELNYLNGKRYGLCKWYGDKRGLLSKKVFFSLIS